MDIRDRSTYTSNLESLGIEGTDPVTYGQSVRISS